MFPKISLTFICSCLFVCLLIFTLFPILYGINYHLKKQVKWRFFFFFSKVSKIIFENRFFIKNISLVYLLLFLCELYFDYHQKKNKNLQVIAKFWVIIIDPFFQKCSPVYLFPVYYPFFIYLFIDIYLFIYR